MSGEHLPAIASLRPPLVSYCSASRQYLSSYITTGSGKRRCELCPMGQCISAAAGVPAKVQRSYFVCCDRDDYARSVYTLAQTT